MSVGRPRRMQIGLLLLALFVGLANLRVFRDTVVAYRQMERPDEVSRYEARFGSLKRVLPGHGVVGYVSDNDPVARSDAASAQARRAFKRYLMTQYALIPLVVLRSVEADLVVGDFETPTSMGAPPPAGFVMVKDFGDGVVLFRRVSN